MENPIRRPADQGFRLIETFCYRPGQGIMRGALHWQRLQASAEVLGFGFDLADILQRVKQIESDDVLRCRLTLGRAGDVQLTTAPMPVSLDKMRFVIATERLSSTDPLLRHKTTRRDVFDQARAAMPGDIDEAVFLNERDEICEGTITNISILTADGHHLTPPLRSGCLPGVYRQSQLNNGHWREAVLTLADLRDAVSIDLVNTLRGSTPAFLVA